ncbi:MULTISPECIES: hypothetical protein [unclassified Neisseria]|nr:MULTISPECIES: hypothetical protein [unclassified Neisseria]MDO1509483.1 hypothetical protein [Neisseria sp. MVDL19-042950]
MVNTGMSKTRIQVRKMGMFHGMLGLLSEDDDVSDGLWACR